MEAAALSIVGALIIIMLGWIKLDLNRLTDKIDALDQRLSARLDDLSARVARIEGRLDEREHR